MSGWIGAWGVSATVADLTVTNSQVISVNTSTDALRITQTGTGNAFVVEDSTTPDNSPFVIDNTGRVGIGGTINTSSLLSLRGTFPTDSVTTSTAAVIQGNISNTVTGTYNGVLGIPSTAAGTTLTTFRGFSSAFQTLGASSTISVMQGYFADASLVAATNNYGFYSNIPAGTGRWNFFANGSADNFFAGNTYTASGTTTMTSGFFHIPAAAGAPTGVPTAVTGRVPMYYDTTNNNFYIYNGAWKKVLLA
jgi:hypothetical protein